MRIENAIKKGELTLCIMMASFGNSDQLFTRHRKSISNNLNRTPASGRRLMARILFILLVLALAELCDGKTMRHNDDELGKVKRYTRGTVLTEIHKIKFSLREKSLTAY